MSRLRLLHLICKQWWTTTNPTFRAALSTLLCSCEPLSLLGALISTDVLCFSVATSNMRSSYLQFIACPLPVLPNSEDFPPPQISVSVGAQSRQTTCSKKKKINEKEMRSIFYPFTAAHFLFLWIEGGGGAERGEGGSCFQDAIEKEKWKRQTAALLLNQCDFRSDGGLGGCILARNKGQWGPAEQRRSGTHETHSRYLQVSFSEL